MLGHDPNRVPDELNIIQNPALGAYALWQFGLGFQESDGEAPPIPLDFLVLPLVLHRPSLDLINSTLKRSGLALFAAKLGEQRQNLLAVHERALLLRELSLQSLAVAINAGLISVRYTDATVRSNTLDGRASKPVMPERIKAFSNAPAKLGYWFSKVNLNQISSTLRVEF